LGRSTFGLGALDKESRQPPLLWYIGHVSDKTHGRYKIFLGMAPGVGKTYHMLLEAHEEMKSGRDVAIGLLESHRRVDTVAVAEGLEVIPRRLVSYRGHEFQEMDLPGILARAPDICLIDELAHTNVVGAEHTKRYEDIEDVLAAGIDVFSTVNVQHLESLNDRVAELSGVRVRETVPDAMLARADEIILIDVTPETLLGRLRAGKVYPEERIASALNNFFKIENLTALREVALREVAEDIGVKRMPAELSGTRQDEVASSAPQAVGERLLVLVQPHPNAQRLIRRAWRSAKRLGGELDVLWVRNPARRMSEDEEHTWRNLRELASLLGVNLIVEDSDSLFESVVKVAKEQKTTYILMGTSRPSGSRVYFRAPLPQRLLWALPGVDVRLVADRAVRAGVGT